MEPDELNAISTPRARAAKARPSLMIVAPSSSQRFAASSAALREAREEPRRLWARRASLSLLRRRGQPSGPEATSRSLTSHGSWTSSDAATRLCTCTSRSPRPRARAAPLPRTDIEASTPPRSAAHHAVAPGSSTVLGRLDAPPPAIRRRARAQCASADYRVIMPGAASSHARERQPAGDAHRLRRGRGARGATHLPARAAPPPRDWRATVLSGRVSSSACSCAAKSPNACASRHRTTSRGSAARDCRCVVFASAGAAPTPGLALRQSAPARYP